MKYRTVLVEDEPSALKLLRTLLAEHRDEIEIVGTAVDGPEAVRVIREAKPDLVFMDIDLPGKNAFQVLDELEESPILVMTTAHPQHALQAFETNTIDYILKPFDPDDLAEAIRKLKVLSSRLAAERPQPLEMQARSGPGLRGIVCKVGDRKIMVPFDEIEYFQSDFRYTAVVCKAGRYLVETPLIEVEKRLVGHGGFGRIYRSTLVNIGFMVSYRFLEDEKAEVFLKDRKEPLRATRAHLEKILDDWI